MKYEKLSKEALNNKIIEQEEISHYEKFETEEKEKLKKAIDIVHELLKNTITDFEYKKENNRTYASFTFRTKRRNYA